MNIFKSELSKSGKVYSEAVHGKLKFKVLSKNICNKTWWHGSDSECDELLKFTDSNVRLVDIMFSNCTDSLPNRPNIVPNN